MATTEYSNTVHIVEEGHTLTFLLQPDGKELIEEYIDHHNPNKGTGETFWKEPYDIIFYELTEHIRCNSDWDWVRPEEVGALTSSVLFATGTTIEDDGERTTYGNVFWFERYAIEDPLETLYKTGKVVFTDS